MMRVLSWDAVPQGRVWNRPPVYQLSIFRFTGPSDTIENVSTFLFIKSSSGEQNVKSSKCRPGNLCPNLTKYYKWIFMMYATICCCSRRLYLLTLRGRFPTLRLLGQEHSLWLNSELIYNHTGRHIDYASTRPGVNKKPFVW